MFTIRYKDTVMRWNDYENVEHHVQTFIYEPISFIKCRGTRLRFYTRGILHRVIGWNVTYIICMCVRACAFVCVFVPLFVCVRVWWTHRIFPCTSAPVRTREITRWPVLCSKRYIYILYNYIFIQDVQPRIIPFRYFLRWGRYSNFVSFFHKIRRYNE